MDQKDIDRLRRLTSFSDLVAYLRDELDWPIEDEDSEELVFDYESAELGIDPKHAVKIESIKQVRPLVDGQPWGILYIEFESKRLPVVVLRRILRAFVATSRRRDPDRPVWCLDDLLFISAQGEPGYRSVSFAHFRQREGRVAELRTFSWDSRETHFHYIKNLNLEALRWPGDDSDVKAWRRQWNRAFAAEHRYAVRTSQMLASEMARHAAIVRDLVTDVYELETKRGPLHRLFNSFREALLHDLTPDAFADMVAQTVAYGLFSAATQTDDLAFDRVVEMIPDTNPFLRDLLAELSAQGEVDLEELGVDQLVELLRQTDVEAILQDFGRQTGSGREDPVVHFYELFLGEYDKEQKVKRGVFYTPDPVVSYIVRSVDYLLRAEFGLKDGLADTTVDPETGEPLVQILDPATGTGTFLAHVIEQVERTVKAKPGVDWNKYVAQHLLPRLYGFELMMAPYAIAHMKLGLRLRQTAYDFVSGERLRVYLTNTLEEPVEKHEALALSGFLSRESTAAARVKRTIPITVVLGNPPYAGHSANDSAWIAGLLRGTDSDGRSVESYFEVDGHSLGERNPKWLNDDYVKFLRFAQWKIEKAGQGVVGMITNHSYLDNPTFRGMRSSLMQTFDEMYVLDLHGNSLKRETAPDGGKDKNVFEIRQGVAIALFVKRGNGGQEPATVYQADLWGLRDEKYGWLSDHDVATTVWQEVRPKPEFYLFLPRDEPALGQYNQFVKVSELLPHYGVGMTTARDDFVIDMDKDRLINRIRLFKHDGGSDDELHFLFNIRRKKQWSIRRAWQMLQGVDDSDRPGLVVPVLYRPFDVRWIFYHDSLVWRTVKRVMRHMSVGENIALIAPRQHKHEFGAYATVHVGTHKTVAVYDINYYFPLYLYPESSRNNLFGELESQGRQPNLNPTIIASLKAAYGQVPAPEDILHYVYAVLYADTYRGKYAEFLKIDFPRVPFTGDFDLFQALAALGRRLVALHLLDDDYPGASWNGRGGVSLLRQPITAFVEGANCATMGAFSKRSCYENGRVYLDTSQRSRSSYFDGVPEDVWNFHIGGYQVCYKWLYDRRGKRGQPGLTLTEEDLAHYQRIVVALKETMRLMGEIDEAIEAHGGWPIE